MDPAISRFRFAKGISNISNVSSSLHLIVVPNTTLCSTEIVVTLDNERVDLFVE
jgi:hypothetical protein